MTAPIISLVSVVVGFTALVLWVYWPSRRNKLEALGRIPFDNDQPEKETEKPNE
ncbi:MAG: cbb3-type cytochrome c oxidase subunit 3 [Pseudomonadales bacterium]|jgi:hypothetical protein